MEPTFIRPVMARYLASRTQRDAPPLQSREGSLADEVAISYRRLSLITDARRASGALLISIGERLQGRPRMAYSSRVDDLSDVAP